MNVSNSIKDMCLLDELDASYKLIVAGLGDLQEIDMANDFYHLPQQLLASGLERLMKCYICLVYEARNNSYPTPEYLSRKLRHDLSHLKNEIVTHYYDVNTRQVLREDLSFISTDVQLQQIIHILSEFGKLARYYNLDIVTGNQNLTIDPTEEWGALERSIEDITPYLGEDKMELLYEDYYPRVNSQIVAMLERFVRAIARQFTLGNHGGKLQQYSPTFTSFRNLQDEKLGATDYRRSVKKQRKNKENWVKRSQEKLDASPWPRKTVSKDNFDGDWPFRAQQVTLECREGMFCVINIKGYDFALNGAAASRWNLPNPHDAGEAILGESVGPFISMARDLGNQHGS